jgi:hypothetical protein
MLATVALVTAVLATPAAQSHPVGPVVGRTSGAPSAQDAPELDFRAPTSMAAYADRLERVDRRRILAVMRLVGLVAPGRPIRVVLAPEGSGLARGTPEWVAGYTRGNSGVIVLFPERAPSYPNDSLEELLQHEVAHVLIGRAAGGRRVPRWFHEGLALAAERAWSLGDRARFVYEVARRGAVPVQSLEARFDGDQASVMLAYSIAGAFVEELLVEHGPEWPSRLLAAMAGGRSFDEAFRETSGSTVEGTNEAFWGRRRFVAVWLPWATNPATMWSLITILALAAIVRLRARRAARRRQWALEEGPDTPTEPPYTVH